MEEKNMQNQEMEGKKGGMKWGQILIGAVLGSVITLGAMAATGGLGQGRLVLDLTEEDSTITVEDEPEMFIDEDKYRFEIMEKADGDEYVGSLSYEKYNGLNEELLLEYVENIPWDLEGGDLSQKQILYYTDKMELNGPTTEIVREDLKKFVGGMAWSGENDTITQTYFTKYVGNLSWD